MVVQLILQEFQEYTIRNVRMLDAERRVFTGAAMPEVSATAKSQIPFHALELLINAEVIPCLLAPGLHQHKGSAPPIASISVRALRDIKP
jgi:hypothetical protein